MKLPLSFVAVTLTLAVGACQPNTPTQTNTSTTASKSSATQALHGSDISAEPIGGDFDLLNLDGQPTRLSHFQGKWVVMSFGYTHCPDVCPTTLLDLAQTMKLLGTDADKVQVIFVSVDPSRDTPAALKEYVPMFDQRFIGLTAKNDAEMAPVLKSWKIAASKVPGQDGYYSVDHSAGMYVLNPQGKAVVFLPYATKPEWIADDLKTLMRSPT